MTPRSMNGGLESLERLKNGQKSILDAIRVKICGLKDPGNIRDIARFEPDFMGFIFHPASPRAANPRILSEVLSQLPGSVQKVGIFADAMPERVIDIAGALALDAIQLHGIETPEYCAALRKETPALKIFKAFGVSDRSSIEAATSYAGSCDSFIFDACKPGQRRIGQKFDWSYLSAYSGDIPFLLAGGIGIEDLGSVREIQARCPAFLGIDVSSSLEIHPGMKSTQKVSELFGRLRHVHAA